MTTTEIVNCEEGLSNLSSLNFENPTFHKVQASQPLKTSFASNPKIVEQTSNDEETNNDEEYFDVSQLNKQLEQIESELRKETVLKELPQDWEKYEDDKGAYYWHVPSGTIQRDPPNAEQDVENKRESIIYYEDEQEDENTQSDPLTSAFLDNVHGVQVPSGGFVVRALGSMPFNADDLTPERSSKAIQRCIIELSTRTDSALRVWGKHAGKGLRLRIERACLKLYDPTSGHVLQLQPLSSIRVWGVNANNDFAFAAADSECLDSPVQKRINRKMQDDEEDEEQEQTLLQKQPHEAVLRCHIFHCEDEELLTNPTSSSCSVAEQIAALLKAEMLRFKKEQSSDQSPIIEEYSSSADSTSSVEYTSATSPTEDQPRKTIIANYLGEHEVDSPVGVDMLNEAIERVVAQKNEPIVCLVHISHCVVSVENTNTAQTLFECRVRFLSFMGISKVDVHHCGFVQQRGERSFVAHIFECRPNSVLMCGAIEQACRARFQKCLDAHRVRCETNEVLDQSSTSSRATSSVRRIKGNLKRAFSKFLTK